MNKDNGTATAPVATTTTDKFQRTETAAIERRPTAVAAEAEHTVKALFTVALAKPRKAVEAEATLLSLCADYEFADEAYYTLPRGSKKVSGLTIRFAEEALRLLTNFRVKSAVVAEDERSRTMLVRVTDIERIVDYEVEFIVDKTVERKFLKDGQTSLGQRLNSDGEVVHLVHATEADMYQKTAILVSKALRDNVLRMLPLKFKLACEKAIVKSLRNGPTDQSRADIIRSIVQVFQDLGVSATALEEFLGHPIDQHSDDDRLLLRDIVKSIQEGQTSWSDVVADRKGKRERKEPIRGTGDLGTVKAGDAAMHQGHEEAAAAMRAHASAKVGPAAAKQSEPKAPPKAAAPEIDEDDIPFDGDPAEADGVAVKIKADTIREIEQFMDSMGYPADAALAFAEKIGLPKLGCLEDHAQLGLNQILDALVKERKALAERDRAAEIKQKAAGRSDALRAEIAETRKLLKVVAAYATDAKWRSAVAAALIPEPFDGDIDACDEAKLTKILGLNRKWMAKVGVGAKA